MSVSTPYTFIPLFAKNAAVVRPTNPNPIIITLLGNL